jgi:putative membrane protein
MMKPRIISMLSPRHIVAVALIAQLGAAGVNAQSQRARERANENARFNRDTASSTDRRNVTDEEFLKDAYSRAVAEESLAQIAVKNSQDAEIQKMGHRVINEQNRAKADLKRIAESKNITLSAELVSADQKTRDRLQGLQGAEFDRAYRDHLNTGFKDMIHLFQDKAQNARDNQVKDVASQYAKMFEEHAQVMGLTGVSAADADRGYVRERDRSSTSTSSSSTTSASTATGRLSQKDEDMLQRAYRMSKTEVEAGRMAAKNSKATKVQSLAQTMVSEHQQMQQAIEDIASRRGFSLNRNLGSGQEDNLDNLKKLSGNEFDQEYNSYLERSHRKAEQLLKDIAASSDSDVRNFGTKYLESVRQHQQSIQREKR